MKKNIILFLFILIFISITGCQNTNVESLNTQELLELTEENLKLKGIIDEKDNKISNLEKLNSRKNDEIIQINKSLNMFKFSAYARQDDYEDRFDYLDKKYKIHSDYEVKDEWYIINDDYFEIELLGYENATKVDFYTLRIESGEGSILIFTDTDNADGWKFSYNNIEEIIDKQKEPDKRGFSYEPYFVIYTEVSLENGEIVKTSKLPIYNR